MAGYRRGRNELRVGLFATVSVMLFLFMFGALTGRGVIRHSSELYVTLPSAEGLLVNDPVLFRGVKVGQVKKLSFRPGGGVVVRTKLNRAVPVSSAAAAVLAPVDMFGRQSLVLREGPGGRPLASGDTLRGDRAAPITDRLAGLGGQVERFLGDSTLMLLHEALRGVGAAGDGVTAAGVEAAALLASQRTSLAEVAEAATTVAANLSLATDPEAMLTLRGDLGAAIESLARASARMDSASASAASVFAKLDRGEGSLGRLVNDPDLYDQASRTVLEVERLVMDVRRDPRRYISLRVF